MLNFARRYGSSLLLCICFIAVALSGFPRESKTEAIEPDAGGTAIVLLCYEFTSCGVPLANGSCPSGVCWRGFFYDCHCGTGWIVGLTCPCYG
jgi:hypothetical protein